MKIALFILLTLFVRDLVEPDNKRFTFPRIFGCVFVFGLLAVTSYVISPPDWLDIYEYIFDGVAFGIYTAIVFPFIFKSPVKNGVIYGVVIAILTIVAQLAVPLIWGWISSRGPGQQIF